MVEVAASGYPSFCRNTTTYTFTWHLAFFRLPRDKAGRPGRRSFNRWNRESRSFPLSQSFQSPEHLVGCNWNFVNAYAYGVVDSVGNGWNDRVQGALACLLAAKWSFAVRNFYQESFNFWRIKRC